MLAWSFSDEETKSQKETMKDPKTHSTRDGQQSELELRPIRCTRVISSFLADHPCSPALSQASPYRHPNPALDFLIPGLSVLLAFWVELLLYLQTLASFISSSSDLIRTPTEYGSPGNTSIPLALGLGLQPNLFLQGYPSAPYVKNGRPRFSSRLLGALTRNSPIDRRPRWIILSHSSPL